MVENLIVLGIVAAAAAVVVRWFVRSVCGRRAACPSCEGCDAAAMLARSNGCGPKLGGPCSSTAPGDAHPEHAP